MSTHPTKSFHQFLHDVGVLNLKQVEVQINTSRDLNEEEIVFKLAELLHSLSLSEHYDLSLRLMLYWKNNFFKNNNNSSHNNSSSFHDQDTRKISELLDRIVEVSKKRKAVQAMSHASPKNSSISNIRRSMSPGEQLSPERDLKVYPSTSRVGDNNQGAKKYKSIFQKLFSDSQSNISESRQNFSRSQGHPERSNISYGSVSRNEGYSQLSIRDAEQLRKLQKDYQKDGALTNEPSQRPTSSQYQSHNTSQRQRKNSRLSGGNSSVIQNPEISEFEQVANLQAHYQSAGVASNRQSQMQLPKNQKNNQSEVMTRKNSHKHDGEMSFRPKSTQEGGQSSTRRSGSNAGDASDRLYKQHFEKEVAMTKKRLAQSEEDQKECSFTPRIDETSKQIAEQKRDHSKSHVDQLYDWEKEKQLRLKEKQGERETAELINLQNKLMLNSSRRIREGSPSAYDELNSTTLSRHDKLFLESLKKKEKQELLENKVLKDIGATFTPRINNYQSNTTPTNTTTTTAKCHGINRSGGDKKSVTSHPKSQTSVSKPSSYNNFPISPQSSRSPSLSNQFSLPAHANTSRASSTTQQLSKIQSMKEFKSPRSLNPTPQQKGQMMTLTSLREMIKKRENVAPSSGQNSIHNLNFTHKISKGLSPEQKRDIQLSPKSSPRSPTYQSSNKKPQQQQQNVQFSQYQQYQQYKSAHARSPSNASTSLKKDSKPPLMLTKEQSAKKRQEYAKYGSQINSAESARELTKGGTKNKKNVPLLPSNKIVTFGSQTPPTMGSTTSRNREQRQVSNNNDNLGRGKNINIELSDDDASIDEGVFYEVEGAYSIENELNSRSKMIMNNHPE